jgi:DNA-binding NtrC family response regulator
MVTTCASPQQAVPLLDQGGFDLVITGDFSSHRSGVLRSTTEVVRSAGSTPVILFSGHTIDLPTVQAVGFRDQITMPFEIGTMIRQVQALLPAV